MSITRVQGNEVNSSGAVTSQAVTLSSGITQGNLVVASVACGSNTTTITGPSGWTQAEINQPAGSNATIETSIWYMVVSAGHAGETSWTWTFGASHTVYLCISEWSATNGWQASPLDQIANGDTSGTPTQSTTIQSGTTSTTAQASELWIASLAYKGSAQTESSITSGWTKDLEATLASNNTMTMLYQIASSTGAAACQYTIGTQEYWAGCVATFKPVTGTQVDHDTAWRGNISATADKNTTWRSNISKTAHHDTAWRGNIGYNTSKNTTFRGNISKTTTKNATWRANIGYSTTKNATWRANIYVAPILSGGFTLFANGTGVASFDHFRVTQYPDPALSLAPVVDRLGSSLVNWNATTPASTTLTMQTSLDGVNWSAATSGSAIAGLSSQPDPTIDIFSSSTSANYTQSHFGSAAPSWSWDTANSRLSASGGANYNGLLLANTIPSFTDGSVIADLDQADGSGIAIRCNGSSTMYALYLYDASASASSNTYILYKIVSGSFTQLAAGSITFTRGTVYRFKLEASGTAITAWMDGVQLCSVTDNAIASGQAAYVANTLLRSYQLRIQPYGSYVSGTPANDVVTGTFVYSKQTLTTSDPSVNPQVQDLTLSARSPQIATGALITQLHDPSKPFAEYFDKEMATLVQASGDYYSDIDNSASLTFAARHATPAPWVLQSSDLELQFTPTVTPTGDASLYRNRQTITNCIGLVTVSNEEKIADGTATSWQLAYPLYSAPTITVQGIAKTVGVQGIDTGKDFYWQAGTNSISQDSSAAKIPSGYVLTFSYTGQYTKNVTRDNLAEQTAHALVATGTTGIVEAWEDGKGMLESNAITYADGLLARFSNPDPVELVCTTRRSGLAKGQMLPVFLPEFKLNNRQLLIIKITRTGEQQADGSVLYFFAIDATDGPNISNWSSALGL